MPAWESAAEPSILVQQPYLGRPSVGFSLFASSINFGEARSNANPMFHRPYNPPAGRDRGALLTQSTGRECLRQRRYRSFLQETGFTQFSRVGRTINSPHEHTAPRSINPTLRALIPVTTINEHLTPVKLIVVYTRANPG